MRREQVSGAAVTTIGSGEKLVLETGAIIEEETGVVRTSADGLKIARGVHTQVAASDTVATGLTTVVACVAQFQSAPTVNQFMVAADVGNQTNAPVAGSILLKTYKPTNNTNDCTPVAATDFTDNLAIAWIAIGT